MIKYLYKGWWRLTKLKVQVKTGYNTDKWRKRIKSRSDITAHLTHLTKNDASYGDIDMVIKILREGKLIGSTTDKGFIIGSNPAVCFQEAPLYGVCQNVYHEQQNQAELGGKTRYHAVGLSFRKDYVFNHGGRPVLYEKTEIAKQMLPKEEWWRIVNFNLENQDKIIDWTHEREWRVKGDFTFDISEAYVLLINHDCYRYFIEHAGEKILSSIKGIITLQSVLE